MTKTYKKKSKHPYEKLNMGVIEQYSMIIKKRKQKNMEAKWRRHRCLYSIVFSK